MQRTTINTGIPTSRFQDSTFFLQELQACQLSRSSRGRWLLARDVGLPVLTAFLSVLCMWSCWALPALLLLQFTEWRPSYVNMWVLWTGPPWIAPGVLSWWSSLLLVLPWSNYRECAWRPHMVACLSTSGVVRRPSRGIRGGCVVPIVVRGRTGIGRCRLCWWGGGRPGGRSCRCAFVWSRSWSRGVFRYGLWVSPCPAELLVERAPVHVSLSPRTSPIRAA